MGLREWEVGGVLLSPFLLYVLLALLGVAWWWARRRALAALEALATLAVVGVVGAVAAFSRLTVTVLGFATAAALSLVSA